MISLGNKRRHAPNRPRAHKCEKFYERKKDAKILSTKLCCLAQRKAARKQEENEEKKES